MTNIPDVLNCPYCGSMHLHHRMVKVFDRIEDDELVTSVVVSHGTASLRAFPNALAGNPSPRRGGLTIAFDCEECSRSPVLEIYQHKGTTKLGWSGFLPDGRPVFDDLPEQRPAIPF